MRLFDFKSVVSVFYVKDIKESISWYKKWLGEPDLVPLESVAEYQISNNSWLQLTCYKDDEFKTGSIIISVDDIHECKSKLNEIGIKTSEIAGYEAILVFDIFDIDGNQISFAQEV
ncbi:VOC family protein [Campylobacter sp.]|uniref:VOC family protein n=1 Tax=Campylobacter sp. TaxID=205 RepID=UPI0026FCD9D9|nr:hypothetical protein [Campylobacter sp.]